MQRLRPEAAKLRTTDEGEEAVVLILREGVFGLLKDAPAGAKGHKGAVDLVNRPSGRARNSCRRDSESKRCRGREGGQEEGCPAVFFLQNLPLFSGERRDISLRKSVVQQCGGCATVSVTYTRQEINLLQSMHSGCLRCMCDNHHRGHVTPYYGITHAYLGTGVGRLWYVRQCTMRAQNELKSRY